MRAVGASWRTLVCLQLGAGLVEAHGGVGDRASSALSRLADIGIDPLTWTLSTTWDALAEAAA